MATHALLSASSSTRWLKCPPSALLCTQGQDSACDYAAEGTDAHALCEFKLRKALGMETDDPIENLTYYNAEMEECAEAYVGFVLEQVEVAKAVCPDPVVLIEERLDFSNYVPDGYGTADCAIIADKCIYITDYKNGIGVMVAAEDNTQLKCYALGALQMFDILYDIDEISMSIFQPRMGNVSTYTITRADLLDWAKTVLAPTAQLAAKGEGEFCAGEHCRFCKVKATCRKRAEYNLLLAQYDFQMPPKLEDDEVEIILEKADDLVSWVKDVQDYALRAALHGKTWQRWKLVEGKSTRRYVNDEAVASVLIKAGFDPYERKVLGITAMTKLLGKKKFDETLKGLVEKPQGKPTLVPISDKRQALSLASEDFKEEN